MAHFVDVPHGRPMDPVRDRSSGIKLGSVNETVTIGIWGVTQKVSVRVTDPPGGGANGISYVVADTHVVQNGCRKFFIRGLVDGCTVTASEPGVAAITPVPVKGKRAFSWNDATPSTNVPTIKLLARGSLQRFPPMPEATWRKSVEDTLGVMKRNPVGAIVLAQAATAGIIITPYIDTQFRNSDAGIAFTPQDFANNAAQGGAAGVLTHEMVHRIVLKVTGTWDDANASFNEPVGYQFEDTDFVSVLVQNMFSSAEHRPLRRKDHTMATLPGVDAADAQIFAMDFDGRLNYLRVHLPSLFNSLKAVNVVWNPIKYFGANSSSM